MENANINVNKEVQRNEDKNSHLRDQNKKFYIYLDSNKTFTKLALEKCYVYHLVNFRDH